MATARRAALSAEGLTAGIVRGKWLLEQQCQGANFLMLDVEPQWILC
jgi:hypothetical protein